MLSRYDPSDTKLELCLDESGYGPLFGRLYMACVVIDDTFDVTRVRDSKKFTSEKKRSEAAEYVKQHALYWNVQWIEPSVIDLINVREANQQGLHNCIRHVLQEITQSNPVVTWKDCRILMDGNVFYPYLVSDDDSKEEGKLIQVPDVTVIKGDDKYAGIAAASILAKVERDAYIAALCDEYPEWDTRYGLRTNKGYGTVQHRRGITEYGRTPLHRMSYDVKPVQG